MVKETESGTVGFVFAISDPARFNACGTWAFGVAFLGRVQYEPTGDTRA